MVQHSCDAAVLKTAAVINSYETQLSARFHKQGQRKIALLTVTNVTDLKLRIKSLFRFIFGEVFKNNNGIKQVYSGRYFTPFMDIHERTVIKLARYDLVVLKIRQPS